MRQLDRLAHNLAVRQRFLVSRTQLLAAGGSDAAINRRVTSGVWIPVHPGVYQVDLRPPTWADRVMRAVLAAGDATAASHRAALLIWELDGISSAPIEITAPYTHGPVPDGAIVHRTRRPLDSTSVDGIVVTTIERTLLDICSLLRPLTAAKAFESAFRQRLTSIEQMHIYLKERGGRGVKGTRMARRILNDRTDEIATGSGGETEALYLIRNAALAEPVLQREFTTASGGHIRPDFYWPHLNKAVEVDGVDAHDSADKLDRDLRRQNEMMDLGIELRRFSARRVRRDPEEFVEEVRRFLAS